MKNVVLLFFSVIIYFNVYGQTYKIKGRIINNTNAPINFVTVKLLSPQNILIKELITSSDGNYIFTGVYNGNYILHFSFFSSLKMKKNITIDKYDLEVEDIKLIDTALLLPEVTVTANTIESFANKKVFRFTLNDKLLSRNAYDLVSLIPKLQSDLDNNIKTVNGETVRILINGINSTEIDLLSIKPVEVIRDRKASCRERVCAIV